MKETNLGDNPLRRFLTDWFRLEKILYLFWFFFWLLNGLDKFFNGKAAKHEVFGNYVQGWFGVNRDDKFIHYFSRLDLPEWMALCALYISGVVEIIIGLLFLQIFFHRTPRSSQVRFAFKLGILMFVAFSIGDILFGDRMELWEHGTFFILTLMTYRLYLMRFDEYAELIGEQHLSSADTDKDGRISTAEFGAFMRRMKTYGVDNEDAPSKNED